MADHLSKKQRSWNMSRVSAKNTKPEITVRRLLHKKGYRFRLYVKSLPGSPDIVLKKHKTIIFVHGCFWHKHQNCKKSTIPKTRTEWWANKLNRNVERFEEVKNKLCLLGWNVVVIWECEIKDSKNLEKIINSIFDE